MGLNWVAFVGVVAVAYVIPGPDFAVVLRSSTRGRRAGIAAALGTQLGLCVHMVLAVVGLSVVLARHPEVLGVVRVVGGAYLLYLGGRLILPTLRRAADPVVPPPDDVSARSAFGQGLFTNLLNPKAILFFAAVLPQFVVPGPVSVAVQVAVLGLVDVALGVVIWAVVIAVGVRLAGVLQTGRVRRWWDRVTGTVLGGMGGGLLLSRA